MLDTLQVFEYYLYIIIIIIIIYYLLFIYKFMYLSVFQGYLNIMI